MQVGDILMSDAQVNIAAYGATLPSANTVPGASWGAGWTNMGLTNSPLRWILNQETHMVYSEQHAGAIDQYKTSEETAFETTLLEITAANLAYALSQNPGESGLITNVAAGAGQDGYEELVHASTFAMHKWVIGFEGKRSLSNGNYEPFRVFLPRATIVLNGELEFSARNNEASIPFKANALVDVGGTGYSFLWQRVTATATS